MLNVIVVGGGYIGLSHIAAYKQLDNARVVGVVDLNKEVGEKQPRKLDANIILHWKKH